jgi:hypothetical protein
MYKISTLIFATICICFSTFAQTTYYVDASRPDNSGAGTSWATAERDLQLAINAAQIGDQVWVKAGTYLPTHDPFGSTSPANNRDKTFTLKNGVKIYGGFAGTETQLAQRNWKTNITTLSGDLGTLNTLSDNAYHVVIAINLGGTSVLDGFTITKGYATAPWQSFITVAGQQIDRYKGGGVYNSNAATGFSNCIIKNNSADCTDSNDDAWGAGVVNDNCSSAFNNCIFDSNSFLNGGSSFGVFGAGMLISSGASTLTNCAFVNNTSGSGFFDASRGGGLYLSSGNTTITNCIFYNNTSQNGAAIACGGAGANTSTIINCTFANNTSSFPGTTYSGFAKAEFRNCILWNNAPTTSSVSGRDEIYSQETNTANQPRFLNCIIRDAVGSPLSVVNTVVSNSIASNPIFSNPADGDGTDNLFMTGDDGLRIQCGSPAIGTGSGVIPAADILNLPRTPLIDMGAYEGGHSNSNFNAIPTVNTTVQLSQNPAGVTHYSSCSNKVAELQSGGTYTLSGVVTARVWIESSQAGNYVKRHYEIMPQLNAATATGRVTLYFTQQEFTDFNAVNVVKLPTGPTDLAGIANIRVEKRGGTSSNGTGLPNSYTGPAQTIANSALGISWNAGAARWEISFDVTGFSGFFVKTQSAVLPLQLMDFSATKNNQCNLVRWQTADERNVLKFEIEKSDDGISFHTVTVIAAAGNGNNQYQYNDCANFTGRVFYRLKMIDMDHALTYSRIVTLDNNAGFIKVYPNPSSNSISIFSGDVLLVNTMARVMDASGRLVLQEKIIALPHSLNIEKLVPGIYYLQLSNGSKIKMIKVK